MNPWNKGMRIGTTEPEPFVIPLGYKSGFPAVEVSLRKLWPERPSKEDRKFIQHFHKPLKRNTLAEMLKDNPSEFNYRKETSSE
jgi:hypothetical protein